LFSDPVRSLWISFGQSKPRETGPNPPGISAQRLGILAVRRDPEDKPDSPAPACPNGLTGGHARRSNSEVSRGREVGAVRQDTVEYPAVSCRPEPRTGQEPVRRLEADLSGAEPGFGRR